MKLQSRVAESDVSIMKGDEIDLRALFMVLWSGRFVIVGMGLLSLLLALPITFNLPNIYRSEALLVATESQEGSNSLASKYGGLASLAGVNLSNEGGGSKKKLALQVLKSRFFINYFVNKHDLSVPLMAAKSWDKDTEALIIDDELYDVGNKAWLREAKPPKLSKPSSLEIYGKFLDLLSVNEEGTGFITVAVEHVSPLVAQKWVEWLIADLNEVIREEDVGRAERAITYLNKQIQATALTDSRAMFFEMIQQHTETAMLAKVEREYVLRTIDPSVVPEKAVRPNKRLRLLVAIIIGLALGVACIALQYSIKQNK